MTTLANPRIVITGGRGFLGRAVCRAGVAAGVDVISVGRSPVSSAAALGLPPAVHCVQADIFDPALWAPYLDGCTAVVHSVGVLREDLAAGRTYERMIFETARVAGDMAVKMGVPRFVFVSAEGVPPGTPPGYMDNKRRAEAYLGALKLALVIARPSLIYGPERPQSVKEKRLADLVSHLPLVGRHLGLSRPLPVDTVARALVRAAMDEAQHGFLHIDDLERLGAG
jgi:uncharacterized protein YbjT (DUF2867 family)